MKKYLGMLIFIFIALGLGGCSEQDATQTPSAISLETDNPTSTPTFVPNPTAT